MRTDASRRAAVASLPSLIGIAGAFFLPFVKGCETMISPLQFSLDSVHKPLALLWVLPRFGVAALLAVLTIYFVVKKRAPERLAALGLATSAAALGVDWWLLLKDGHTPLLWFAAMIVVTLGSAYLLVTAWRSRSWARWERFIAAHAGMSSPLCGIVLTAGSWRSVGAGGYVYVTSTVILLTLFARSRFRQRAIARAPNS